MSVFQDGTMISTNLKKDQIIWSDCAIHILFTANMSLATADI